jgi:Kdo2-lipid IVA lauroyltransferase/acyltransferase
MGKTREHRSEKVEFLLIKCLFFIAKSIPLLISSWLGRGLGALAFRLLKSRRNLTIENIREARERGHLPQNTNDLQLARRTWENLCLLGIEFAYYHSSPEAIRRAVSLEGAENLKRALEKKKGVVLLTSHIGNWELMGMAFAVNGFNPNSIIQVQANGKMNEYINECRQKIGIKLIRKKGFLRPIIEALNRNEIVAFFTDQNAHGSGIPLQVFGREARIPRGAAEFALRLDKPVVFAYMIRETPLKHRLIISEEIQLTRTGDYEKDLQQNTAHFMELIQAAVSRCPEQWLWMHKLWNTRIKV